MNFPGNEIQFDRNVKLKDNLNTDEVSDIGFFRS